MRVSKFVIITALYPNFLSVYLTVMTELTNNSHQFAKLAKVLWILAIIVFILSLVVIIIKVSVSSPVSALRYNVILGVSEIGSRYKLLQLPLAGFLIGIVNYVLVRYNRTNQQILPLLASMVTVALNIILLLAALLLFQVN